MTEIDRAFPISEQMFDSSGLEKLVDECEGLRRTLKPAARKALEVCELVRTRTSVESDDFLRNSNTPVNAGTQSVNNPGLPAGSPLLARALNPGLCAQNRRRASNSANAPSSHPAVRIFSALLPHLGHWSNHSPGISASLCSATVFVQPHPSHSKVKGLGLMGILKLLGLFADVLPSVHSTARISQFDLLADSTLTRTPIPRTSGQ
ncbi:hypothetical protein [Pseudomonas aeruginosa]|uniref:hypothetical protein n=1 Tax=Pseudomonas aeruginosa TaxID=287 RepID=UPI001C1007CB|nr:hypothetical protein [Pseudomonas aeruginosa]